MCNDILAAAKEMLNDISRSIHSAPNAAKMRMNIKVPSSLGRAA
jgi:hypothetical protein